MAVFTVQTPSGKKLKIEAATQADAIRGAQEWSANNTSQGRAQRDAQSKAKRANRSGAVLTGQGLMMGFGDEFAGLVVGAERGVKNAFATARGQPIPYTAAEARDAMVAAERAENNAFAERRPMTNMGLQVTGSLLTGGIGAPARVITGARSLRGVVARSAGLGAGAGAVAGAGTAEGGVGPRLVGAGKGAVVGGAAGAAAPIVARTAVTGGQAAAGAVRRRPAPAPTLDDLRARKTAAYAAVDQAGVRYSPDATTGMVDDITAQAEAARLNPRRHPKAASALSDDIQPLRGQAPTLTELDQLRQVIRRDVANAPDDAEAEFGRKLIAGIDEFVSRAGSGDVVAGDAEEAAALLAQARDFNTRYRKVESVTEAVDRARVRAGSTGSGGNVDNATRQELRRVLEHTPNLTPAERAALERAVIGSKGQNLARQVGKLSPQGNGLMAAGNLGAAAFAGPVGAIPGVAGMISKHIADRTTQQRVGELIRLMAEGGQEAPRAARTFAELAARDPRVARIQAEMASAGGAAAGREAGRPRAVMVNSYAPDGTPMLQEY